MKQGKADFANHNSADIINAFLGRGLYEKMGPQDVRTVGAGHDYMFMFWTTPDSGIETISDLKGKVVYVAQKANPMFWGMAKQQLASAGLTLDDLKAQLTFGVIRDAARDMIEGRVDAMLCPVVPSSVMEINEAKGETKFVTLTKEQAGYVMEHDEGYFMQDIAANVATTGTITIPLMKKTGYEKNYAGAVEATSSLGGMFMPPIMGATAFLIAEFLQISYWSVCLAAFLPAMAYYLTLLVQVDLEAAKIGLKGLPREGLPSLRKTLKGGWQYLLPFAFLLFLLGVLRYSAQTSIMYTLGALVLVGSLKKESRLTPRRIVSAFEDAARGMLPIIPLCTAIGILVGALSMTGAGTNLSSGLMEASGGHLPILLIMTAFAAFILGMGMTAVSVYLLTVVLLAPALIRAGVEPIAAHMFLFYFGCLSFITPPVCVDAYIAAGISGGSPFQTGFRAMRLAFAAFLVPWAFVINPGILMIGSPLHVISSFFFVTLGAVAVGCVFENFVLTRLKKWERLLLVMAGLCVFIPNILTRGIGLTLLAVFLANQIRRARQAK
jgi:TRAP transporter 4TM/12TM fusion protein